LENVMRTFLPLLAGLGLLSTAALAEPPAKLSEAQLGQVAAG
jgi:hypothetical protein